jgi:AcrR family transcriptional regulator
MEGDQGGQGHERATDGREQQDRDCGQHDLGRYWDPPGDDHRRVLYVRMTEVPTAAVSPSTHDRLLEAARACVREKGLANTTSRAITSRAGANLAAITYHFGSKDRLVAEALLSTIRARLRPALNVLRREDIEPPARVLTTVAALQSAFLEAADDAPAYLEALVQARHLPALEAGVRELFSELRGFFAAQITDQRDQGELPSWVDPPAMATLILAAANGIVLQAALDDGAPDFVAVGGQFVQLLLAARR